MLKKLILVLFLFMALATTHSVVQAATAPAQLSIPGTVLDIGGIAAPSAMVQIYDGDAIIGSVVADTGGNWQKSFPAIESGLHRIAISYTDDDGRISATVTETLNVRAQRTTTAHYFLPPTLSIIPGSVPEGGIITLTGSSAANATIDISVDGGALILRPQTDKDGRYSIAFDTGSYFIGQHIVEATARKVAETSYPTGVASFTVTSVDASNNLPRTLTPPLITTSSPLITADQSVVIRGEAAPNSQIIAYLDNQEVGSTFANEQGSWFINLFLTQPQQQLRVRACYEQDCSELSSSLEITFEGSTFCPANFQLGRYRFFDLGTDDTVSLRLLNPAQSPPYEILIDWGDGNTQRFNHDSSVGFEMTHRYESQGQFNGSLTLSDASGCSVERFFSASVSSSDFDWRLLLAGIPFVLGGLMIMAVRTRRQIVTKRRATATTSG